MSSKDILDLGNQVAFVTGAGRGAGRGIALMLADHNAKVAVNDFVLERAEEVAEEIRAAGGQAIAVQADVSSMESVKAAAAKTEAELGAPTILVNNAGMAGPTGEIGHLQLFWESDPAEWGNFVDTNFYGVMNCCYALLPGMVAAQRGRVVTIVSDSGRIGEARLAVYAGAKAGAAGFMRSLAKETGRFGITANCISLSSLVPPIPADQMAAFMQSDHVKKALSQYIIRRYGTADDVAAMTLFLCSDASSWITGQTYPVNGGYSVTV